MDEGQTNDYVARQPNGKSIPPLQWLIPQIKRYWAMALGDTAILRFLVFDREKYTLSTKTISRIRKQYNMPGVRKQNHSGRDLALAVAAVRERYPRLGARNIRNVLQAENNMLISRATVVRHLQATEPREMAQRLSHRFKRKRFWTAGLNDIWAMDQHDKWLRFGLFLHLGVEPHSGTLLWVKIWWNNSNPRLPCKYFLDTARERGGIPMLTQSDPGTENNHIANAQTRMRQFCDPALMGTIQHRYMGKHNNIKPEIKWSQLRRDFSPGFEDALDFALNNELFDPGKRIEALAFRWLAIPWLQAELDMYRVRVNTSRPRKDHHKMLPLGIPDLIYERPDLFEPKSADFKITVPDHLLDEMEEIYAPQTHECFELVPAWFLPRIQFVYFDEMGGPEISLQTIWDVLGEVIGRLRWHETEKWLDGYLPAPEMGPEALPLIDGAAPARARFVDDDGEFVDDDEPGFKVIEVPYPEAEWTDEE